MAGWAPFLRTQLPLAPIKTFVNTIRHRQQERVDLKRIPQAVRERQVGIQSACCYLVPWPHWVNTTMGQGLCSASLARSISCHLRCKSKLFVTQGNTSRTKSSALALAAVNKGAFDLWDKWVWNHSSRINREPCHITLLTTTMLHFEPVKPLQP